MSYQAIRLRFNEKRDVYSREAIEKAEKSYKHYAKLTEQQAGNGSSSSLKVNKKRRRSDNVEAIDRTKSLIDYAEVKVGSVYVGVVVQSNNNCSFINIGMRDRRKGDNTNATKEGMMWGVIKIGTTIKVRVTKKYQTQQGKSGIKKDFLDLVQVQ